MRSAAGSRTLRRRSAWLGSLLLLAVIAALALIHRRSPDEPPPSPLPVLRSPKLERNTEHGALRSDPGRRLDGEPSYSARLAGGVGNAYARGVTEVRWRDGDTVRYSVALFLPKGFTRRMQGEVDLIRW